MTKTRKLVLASVFTALAFVAELLIHIKVAGFLTYDAKDAILTLGSLIYGPVYGLISALVVSLIEMVTVSTTGIWGFIMNFISTAIFVCLASLIYKKWRTLKAAIIGLLLSIFSMTIVMLGLNLLITPIYTGMSIDSVAKMIPTILLPFNLLKAISNAALTLVLYKPTISVLRSTKIIKDGDKMNFDKKTIAILIIGIIIIIAAVVIMINVI